MGSTWLDCYRGAAILKRLNWVNTLFLSITPLVGIVGTVFWAMSAQFNMATVWLAIALFIATALAITAGYHRLFSHNSYQAIWPLRLLLVLLGSGAFQGSVMEWCTDHRRHHRYVDTEKDPYNINQGFWYAHIGWLLFLDRSKRDFSNVADLEADPILRVQQKYFVIFAVVMGFGFPAAIALLWGDFWGGLLVAGALRITFVQHMTFCINSVCHYFGKSNYTDKQSAKDNWVTALFTMGEGFHNFHHQFSLDYRNGIRFYHFDPTKWFIRGLSFIGVTSDLKTVSEAKILRYSVSLDHDSVTDPSLISQHFKPLYTRIIDTLAFIEKLEKEYVELKMKGYRESVRQCRAQLKQTQRDLNKSIYEWKKLIKSRLKPISSTSI